MHGEYREIDRPERIVEIPIAADRVSAPSFPRPKTYSVGVYPPRPQSEIRNRSAAIPKIFVRRIGESSRHGFGHV
jgi:hypothetical protein